MVKKRSSRNTKKPVKTTKKNTKRTKKTTKKRAATKRPATKKKSAVHSVKPKTEEELRATGKTTAEIRDLPSTYIKHSASELQKMRIAKKKEAFIEAFKTLGRVDLSTKAAGICYGQPHRWAKEDEDFANAWEEARYVSADHLEDAAFERSVTGVLKPVFQNGHLVGYERRYSDGLTRFLLEGMKPEKYRRPVGAAPPPDPEGKKKRGMSDELANFIKANVLGVKVPEKKGED